MIGKITVDGNEKNLYNQNNKILLAVVKGE